MTLPRASTSARRGQGAGGFGRDRLVTADGLAPLSPDGQRPTAPDQDRIAVAESRELADGGHTER